MFRQSSLPFPPPISDTPPQQPSSSSPQPQQHISSPSPVKSHPLHNFPLSDLRWSMNHNNTHHRLRKSSSSSSPAVRSPVKLIDEDGSGSKILIRIRTKTNETDGERISDDEFGAKSWNLRPRKPPPTKKRSIGNGNGNGVVVKRCDEVVAKGTVRTEAIRSRNGADAKMVAERKEEKKKPRLTISLSKFEIDEDIYALTGSKPSRRPKKRAKNLQKQLDVLFPGLWMGNVSSDAYKVSDHA